MQGSEAVDLSGERQERLKKCCEPRWSGAVGKGLEYPHGELLTVVRYIGRGADETFEFCTIVFGQDTQFRKEVETRGWDPISGDKQTNPEGLVVVMNVVDDTVHDLRWNRHRRRGRRKRGDGQWFDVAGDRVQRPDLSRRP